MFMPGQEAISPEEIKAGELEAFETLKMVATGSVLLYLSPFAIDFVRRLF
ncbi:hypothetical protein TMEN_9706 [Trichophyton mentagrophytes]|uniref:Mitochondrial outer membrane translocase complex, subunit Tom5 n=4 Tax=Trichophyton TaxID=5550 RepID=A0A059JD12_TRIIM|nr:uncharacterized protein TERG_05209 [Trichophyton rubrum CBS 118892]EZF23430.1 hypothetical protein H100_03886 [Trichophyton rubrum MR850]EZF35916.1 hypothetical protein H101_00548 [Trichophyton interdigitale H6]EZF42588.1 hypothetical protein H102_03873 [Trichophyton rubrum CBS 100081]EZF53204.1 hypothetical protein H103_03887 [Trichophyton rubrum CBS 288.86]EZF63872.1 hypothetical protein H104_03872 [Trichophyton rubrum CBS 289.86]EZF74192.1 hypothetical protein H105_03900 [Trichophyton s